MYVGRRCPEYPLPLCTSVYYVLHIVDSVHCTLCTLCTLLTVYTVQVQSRGVLNTPCVCVRLCTMYFTWSTVQRRPKYPLRSDKNWSEGRCWCRGEGLIISQTTSLLPVVLYCSVAILYFEITIFLIIF